MSKATKVVVASTVMLSFISFWRAAAIVLCDLASSAYYAGGIAEGYIGKSAPWFILAIMLSSYAVRAIYIESCSMFVRGGVYRVVHEAMGGLLAKFSVSALMFDYVLTGPISGVSAGLYLAGLINDTARLAGHPNLHVEPQSFSAVFAAAVTIYFWKKNVIGMHESSQKALRIMQLTTIMVVLLIAWCLITIALRGYSPVPLPTTANIHFGEGANDALGWLRGTKWPAFTAIAIMIGLGHSLLAMSGEESLAQVNREIAYPKLKNLERAGFVIFIYSMLFTSLVSFFAVMIIPDQERVNTYLGNLIGGLAMHMVGPVELRLLFQAFVVVVGTVILSGAVNTAIVGSNGVLNRVAEDGVLPDWFRQPHRKFGTTSRIITLIAALQIACLILTRGDLLLLGDAYAFGVVWSFAMKALAVLVLRYRQPGKREFQVPLNFRIAGVEIPVGLGMIFLFLFSMAIINLFTKKVATIWGFGFTVVIFIVFELSEQYNKKKMRERSPDLEKFRLDTAPELSANSVSVRPGSVLVAVRNPNQLDHLKYTLEKTNTAKIDVVVLTVKRVSEAGSGEHDLDAQQIFTGDIAKLFSNVVTLAEKAGKHVELMVVPGIDPNWAIMETAQRLKSSLVVMGLSGKMTPDEQAKAFGNAWEHLPPPRPQLSLQIFDPERGVKKYFNLGPHPPRLWPQDVELLHELWLELSERGPGPKLHHRDVVRVALKRMEAELRSNHAGDVVQDILTETAGSDAESEPESTTYSGTPPDQTSPHS
ncbi:MAG TPA: APC family permease [Bryobacteraceae bacterium]|nr:APC family permease [Bryobacteraceae bacterium]